MPDLGMSHMAAELRMVVRGESRAHRFLRARLMFLVLATLALDAVATVTIYLLESTDTVNDPYVPAVFTLLPDLTIHRAYDGYWFWGRPTMEELRADLREITRAIR